MVCCLLVAPAPAPELDDLGLGEEGLEFLISVNSFLIVWYYEEVAEVRRAFESVSWESVVPLLVVASAIRSRWPSMAWSARLLVCVKDGPDTAWNSSASVEV